MSASSFYARKLFELTGLVPIGAFLVEHLYQNFQIVGADGAQRFDKIVVDLQTNPFVIYAEILLIALPLLYHAVYGLFVVRLARPNAGEYGYLRNWTFVLQRITGIVLFFFIGYHVWNTRIYPLLHPTDPTLQHVGSETLVSTAYMQRYFNESLAGVPLRWIYVTALVAACFHFANGLWNLGIHWGLLVSRAAQRRFGWICLGLGGALLYMGVRSVLTFASLGS